MRLVLARCLDDPQALLAELQAHGRRGDLVGLAVQQEWAALLEAVLGPRGERPVSGPDDGDRPGATWAALAGSPLAPPPQERASGRTEAPPDGPSGPSGSLSCAAAAALASPPPIQRAARKLLEPLGPALVLGSGGSRGGRRWCVQPLTHLETAVTACGIWLAAQGLDPAGCELFDPLPLHHVSGLMPLLRARAWGARLRWLPPALLRDPSQLLAEACPDPQRPALISLVPTQLQRLLDHPEGVDWLGRFALIWVGGAALPPTLAERCRALRLPLSPCYGSTETAAMVAAQAPARFLAGATGCGQALPHAELAVCPASGALRIRSASLAIGFWQSGHLLALPGQEGWWTSGDAARLGPSGLELLGRLDGAIQSGAETVFPDQVRLRLLALCEAAGLPLAELLVLPEPDPLWGHRLVALLRLSPGPEGTASAGLSAPLLEALQHLARELPPPQRPRRWLVCPELEPTPAGKWDALRWRSWLATQPAQSG